MKSKAYYRDLFELNEKYEMTGRPIIFHGACHGCQSQRENGIERCFGCQNFDGDWSLPNLTTVVEIKCEHCGQTRRVE